MLISVELSYYPLADDYKPPVRALIERLQESSLDVRSNALSTQLFGDYDIVMAVLTEAMKWSFESYGKAVFVARFVEGDRSSGD